MNATIKEIIEMLMKQNKFTDGEMLEIMTMHFTDKMDLTTASYIISLRKLRFTEMEVAKLFEHFSTRIEDIINNRLAMEDLPEEVREFLKKEVCLQFLREDRQYD